MCYAIELHVATGRQKGESCLDLFGKRCATAPKQGPQSTVKAELLSMKADAGAAGGGAGGSTGAGAGGGIGFGLLLMGAERVNGTELVSAVAGLDDKVRVADLALTGQAVFDWETLRGRVVVGVARAAQRAGRPTVVLCHRLDVGRREMSGHGIDAAYAIDDMADGTQGDPSAPLRERLAGLAERVARTWSR